MKLETILKSRNKWGLIGLTLGGIWTVSTCFFCVGDVTYYDWDAATSEMIGMNIGALLGVPLIFGAIGFLAGLSYDIFRRQTR
ncbi:hypothetical protein [Rhizobium herbae]|uniref:Uncharacterized protein n=1 Tax=Rhizobium herbae TaxID=508661 RepID=A0ABS4EGT0_9HYPH|nr:hypothetical protein [Rhizobium herbae]MBP1857142.1 hypothetical protein [Rhizobium herbae]